MSTPDTSPIWLTAKTRMITERRLRKWGFVGHLAVTWYSFWLIVFSIWAALKDAGPLLNFVSIGLSIFLFALSLLFYGLKFEEEAGKFRSSYLDLQKIYRSSSADQAKLDRYHENLDRYPNHAPYDWDAMLFDAKRAGQTYTNSKGDIPVTFRMQLGVHIRRALTGIIYAVVFVAPLIGAYFVAR